MEGCFGASWERTPRSRRVSENLNGARRRAHLLLEFEGDFVEFCLDFTAGRGDEQDEVEHAL